MRQYPYASTIGSIMYAMICTRLDVSYALSVGSRYQSYSGLCRPSDNQGTTGRLPVGPNGDTRRAGQGANQPHAPREGRPLARGRSIEGPPFLERGYHLK